MPENAFQALPASIRNENGGKLYSFTLQKLEEIGIYDGHLRHWKRKLQELRLEPNLVPEEYLPTKRGSTQNGTPNAWCTMRRDWDESRGRPIDSKQRLACASYNYLVWILLDKLNRPVTPREIWSLIFVWHGKCGCSMINQSLRSTLTIGAEFVSAEKEPGNPNDSFWKLEKSIDEVKRIKGKKVLEKTEEQAKKSEKRPSDDSSGTMSATPNKKHKIGPSYEESTSTSSDNQGNLEEPGEPRNETRIIPPARLAIVGLPFSRPKRKNGRVNSNIEPTKDILPSGLGHPRGMKRQAMPKESTLEDFKPSERDSGKRKSGSPRGKDANKPKSDKAKSVVGETYHQHLFTNAAMRREQIKWFQIEWDEEFLEEAAERRRKVLESLDQRFSEASEIILGY